MDWEEVKKDTETRDIKILRRGKNIGEHKTRIHFLALYYPTAVSNVRLVLGSWRPEHGDRRRLSFVGRRNAQGTYEYPFLSSTPPSIPLKETASQQQQPTTPENSGVSLIATRLWWRAKQHTSSLPVDSEKAVLGRGTGVVRRG